MTAFLEHLKQLDLADVTRRSVLVDYCLLITSRFQTKITVETTKTCTETSVIMMCENNNNNANCEDKN